MKNLFSFNWIAQEEDLSLLSDLTENDTCAASHLFHEGKDFLQRLQLFRVFDVKLGKIVEVVSQPWVAGRCRLLEGGSQRGCNDTKNRYRQHDLPKHETVRTLWILRVAAHAQIPATVASNIGAISWRPESIRKCVNV
jgi:hypothetical protein